MTAKQAPDSQAVHAALKAEPAAYEDWQSIGRWQGGNSMSRYSASGASPRWGRQLPARRADTMD
jgi:hypothetical protein